MIVERKNKYLNGINSEEDVFDILFNELKDEIMGFC